MDWKDLIRHYVDLALPLMFIRAPKGVLACGYFDPGTFDHAEHPMAGAVVRRVSTFEDMLERKVDPGDISKMAHALGVRPGMSGRQVLELFRR